MNDLSLIDTARFWAKVDFDLDDVESCWEWRSTRSSTGYGWHRVAGRIISAHRLAFALFNDGIEDGCWILHRCDNPPCCNPTHLFAGTPKDNTQDMIAKGRKPRTFCDPSKFNIGEWRAKNLPFRGSSHPGAKLTESVVRQIKEAIARGEQGIAIAATFGCSAYTVSNIKTGKQWGHV